MIAGEQAGVFGVMLLLGAGLCALRGAVGLLLRCMRWGAAEGAADIAAGVIGAAAVTAAALVLRVAADRWYVLAGALTGVMLAALLMMLARCFWRMMAAKMKKVSQNRPEA